MTPTKKILVIEDEVALAMVLNDKLMHEGYAVIKTPDGQKGLAMAISEHPDLIMLDVSLPAMNGIEILKELRKNDVTKGIEVVLLTNSSDSTLLADALSLGAHDYLVKSDWQLEEVVKLVRTKLK